MSGIPHGLGRESIPWLVALGAGLFVMLPAAAQAGCTVEVETVCRSLIPTTLALPPPTYYWEGSVQVSCPVAAGFTTAERGASVVVPFAAEVRVSFCHGYAGQVGSLTLTAPAPAAPIGTSVWGDQVTLDDVTIDLSLGEFAAGEVLTFTYATSFGTTPYEWSSGTDNVAVRAIGNTRILGWEDQPVSSADKDYNDVFAVVEFVAAGCVDTDSDGWCDADDNCPYIYNLEQVDLDGDGVGDACDDCVDGDFDSVCDDVDNCWAVANTDQADTDADGFGDACDECLDVDEDFVCDDFDNCPGTPNTDQADADVDGTGDACDDCVDVDGDAVCDGDDNCLDLYNPGQEDVDADGTGDACDACIDVDGDSVCDDLDNCPTSWNPGQEDGDADGQGDACDTDTCVDADQDTICDHEDACGGTILPDTVPTVALKPWRWADVDGDGVFDTLPSKGQGPGRSYTIDDTQGCSCAQIIDAFDLGAGHTMHGCSISAMDEWLAHLAL